MTLAFRKYNLTHQEADEGLKIAKKLKQEGLTSEQAIEAVNLLKTLETLYQFRSRRNAFTDGIQRAVCDEHICESMRKLREQLRKINPFVRIVG